MSIEFIGAFESCYLPQHDVDIVESTEHSVRWKEDLDLLRECGVSTLRYPVRWHRIEANQGHYDWSHTDEVLGHIRDQGFRPIVDLLHHCSYPAWLTHGFADPRFRNAYLSYCEAFAKRYDWIPAYTLLNEPFTTLFLTGHEGIWPPYWNGMRAFVRISRNVFPAVTAAARMYRDLLPNAEHVYVEPCEGHSAAQASGEQWAALANDRRFFFLDVMLGREIDPARPFAAELVAANGADLLEIEGGHIDLLGLDYYAHLEWSFDGIAGTCPSPTPVGLSRLLLEYWDRYRLPMILGETNIRGFASDRVSWLKYTLEQCEAAQAAGADLRGYCWFPFIDST
ncbi:MAG: family 1 glycosylhydrolase, partial [Actinomycetota bacterium]|nr:family 1 glycosylhydrolase [Actinomycetota bacterium]